MELVLQIVLERAERRGFVEERVGVEVQEWIVCPSAFPSAPSVLPRCGCCGRFDFLIEI